MERGVVNGSEGPGNLDGATIISSQRSPSSGGTRLGDLLSIDVDKLPAAPTCLEQIEAGAFHYFSSIKWQIRKFEDQLREFGEELDSVAKGLMGGVDPLIPHIQKVAFSLEEILEAIPYLPLPAGTPELCQTASTDLKSFFESLLTGQGKIDADSDIPQQFMELRVKALQAFGHVPRYEVKKYVICCRDKEGVDLNLPLDTLLSMTGTEGVLFDVDNCLIISEHLQEAVWKQVVTKWLSSMEDLPESEGVISDLKNEVEHIFKNGRMDRLLPVMFETADDFNAYPEGVNDHQGLRRWLTKERQTLLLEKCAEGEIPMMEGAKSLLLRLYERGIKMGIFTSCEEDLVVPLLKYHLDNKPGQPGFDKLIPPEHRVFGPDLQEKGLPNKPNHTGWVIGAEGLGLPVSKVAIVDDRKNTAGEAARAKVNGHQDQFAAVIWLYHDPEIPDSAGANADARSIEDGLKWFGRDDFDPKTVRITIKDLSKIT